MKEIVREGRNLFCKLKDSIYQKRDDEVISIIEGHKQWISRNENLLPKVFLDTWQDVLDLEMKLNNVKQTPNSSKIIDEVVKANAHCRQRLLKTINELNESLKNSQGL